MKSDKTPRPTFCDAAAPAPWRAAPGVRRLALAALAALAGFAVSFTPLRAQTNSEEQRRWNQPVEPFRVAGNVYYVGAHEVAAYLVATPEGHVILDSGFEETVPQLLANVETLGFRPTDVRLLIASHGHFDHVGGMATLRERTGAQILMSAADAELAARGGQGDPNFGDDFAYRPFRPDRLIADGEVVELGGSRLVAHLTAGHTRGCTTWTLRVEEHGRPLDVAFLCSVTAPGYRLLGNAGHPDIVADYQATFRRLAELPVDVFLANHGSFFDLHGKRAALCANPAVNPFVDPEGWRRHLERQREAFESRLAAQRAEAGG
jgi:metallo-beta-lactamase class B